MLKAWVTWHDQCEYISCCSDKKKKEEEEEICTGLPCQSFSYNILIIDSAPYTSSWIETFSSFVLVSDIVGVIRVDDMMWMHGLGESMHIWLAPYEYPWHLIPPPMFPNFFFLPIIYV